MEKANCSKNYNFSTIDGQAQSFGWYVDMSCSCRLSNLSITRIFSTFSLEMYSGQEVLKRLLRIFVIASFMGVVSLGSVVWNSFHISVSSYRMDSNHAFKFN